MTLADDLLAGPPAPPSTNVNRPTHPKGWEPTLTIKDAAAEGVAILPSPDAEDSELLKGMNLDPDTWFIVDGTQEFRRWQQSPGDEYLYYCKFKATRTAPNSDPEFDEACNLLLKHKPRKHKATNEGTARIFCLSDWQVGKGEGGGSKAIAERIQDFIDQATRIVKQEKPEAIYIVGMGDMVERCSGNYPSQAFTTDLNEREQERFARRGILAVIKALAPHAPKVVVSCVPGNHGEVRQNGKAYTGPGDNADVAVFEQVMDILNDAPAYEHVSWVIPGEDLTVTLDIEGVAVAFAHGHQFNKGASPQQKAVNWWKGQAMGRFNPGDATVLVSGHYHHLQALSTHGRLWLQCPALDGGSKWFTDTTGDWSLPGTLTFKVANERPCGIQVIGEGAI